MLLIQSKEMDVSTSMVIQWLIYHNIKFLRVNGETDFMWCDFELNQYGAIKIILKDRDNNKFDLSQYSSFWYRRGDWYIAKPNLEKFKEQAVSILNKEWEILRETIEYYLGQLPHLGRIKDEKYHNKIKALMIAGSVGILIPYTLITGSKKRITTHVNSSEAYITKAVSNMFNIVDNGQNRIVGTRRISRSNTKCLQSIFASTLIQKEIPKAFELRIFFIKKTFYCMAIFSQSDPQTELDFRNYNREKPNRNVPFSLPLGIRKKLLKFINIMQLDTGSIDMIVTPKGKFIFLEVNPVGQFGWVSHNCNYYLEEKIALYFKSVA